MLLFLFKILQIRLVLIQLSEIVKERTNYSSSGIPNLLSISCSLDIDLCYELYVGFAVAVTYFKFYNDWLLGHLEHELLSLRELKKGSIEE